MTKYYQDGSFSGTGDVSDLKSEDININSSVILLLSATEVSFADDGQTTLYTVPVGKRCVLFGAMVVAAADCGATTITIGQVGALTDFLAAQTLGNLDAQYDAAWLVPVPNATPVKVESYAAGTVIQADVGAHAGSAGNTVYLYGMLY